MYTCTFDTIDLEVFSFVMRSWISCKNFLLSVKGRGSTYFSSETNTHKKF